jgi:hypothetical protein
VRGVKLSCIKALGLEVDTAPDILTRSVKIMFLVNATY